LKNLKETLESLKKSGKRAKMLYTVPTGTNPSGIVIPMERRREIYKLACEYDFLILEDDPYHFLQFPDSESTDGDESTAALKTREECQRYLNETLMQSFFSMDTEGRVVRLDSTSKVLSAGNRIGWVTASKQILEKFDLIQQIDSIHSSGIGQAIMGHLLKQWGVIGFTNHVRQVARFYRIRRDFMNQCLLECTNQYTKRVGSKIQKKKLIEWTIPEAGFFIWIKTCLEDTSEMLNKYLVEKRIMFMPGNVFFVDGGQKCSYVRLSFSVVNNGDMKKGVEKLLEMIKGEVEAQDGSLDMGISPNFNRRENVM